MNHSNGGAHQGSAHGSWAAGSKVPTWSCRPQMPAGAIHGVGGCWVPAKHKNAPTGLLRALRPIIVSMGRVAQALSTGNNGARRLPRKVRDRALTRLYQFSRDHRLPRPPVVDVPSNLPPLADR